MGVIRYFFGGVETKLRAHLKLKRFLTDRGLIVLSKLIANRVQTRFGVFIPAKVLVPVSTHFPHPASIVIGEGVRIGENVTIYQNVTLGGARLGDWKADRYPIIEDDVTIFAGAVVVGKVKIGRGSTIGANSVVTRDVPPGSTAVGAPARIVFRKTKSSIL